MESRYLNPFNLPSSLGWWFFVLAILALMLVAIEIGFRLGKRAGPRISEDTKTWIAAGEGALLGVLGLLLGFTVSMAVSRFDARRVLVVDEANAIGTSYWRSLLVPAPEGTEIDNLLREYLNLQLQLTGNGRFGSRLQATRERSAQLETELWSRAAAFAQKDPHSLPAGLLLQSLNQTFDLESSRIAAFNARVPESVIAVDAVAALLAVSLVGYSFGLSGSRNPFTVFGITMSIALVLAVIVDLDQPRTGMIRVSQQPLIDLQRQLGAPQR